MYYDVRAIRAMYPHPVPARCLRFTERAYCVGGALQCFVEQMEVPRGGAFPSPHSLSAVLRKANPHLNRFEARALAGQITSANDTGDFQRAWERLEESLNRHQDLGLAARLASQETTLKRVRPARRTDVDQRPVRD